MLDSSNHACIQSGYVMLAFGCRRVSELVTVRYSDVIQTVVIIEDQTIVLRFQTIQILLKQLRQTSAMFSALWLNTTDFRPVFRIIVSNTSHKRSSTPCSIHTSSQARYRCAKYHWLSVSKILGINYTSVAVEYIHTHIHIANRYCIQLKKTYTL